MKSEIFRCGKEFLISTFWIVVGSMMAAFAIEAFFIPSGLIDGGMVGVALIVASKTRQDFFPYFSILFHIPFLFLSYKVIGKRFLINMCIAQLAFSLSCLLFHDIFFIDMETLEVVIVGGGLLGAGVGLIIRIGGSIDGSEILAIIISKKSSFTIGQVILFLNIVVFGMLAIVSTDLHAALKSLIAYIVAIKVIDMIIVGSDEIKSVMIVANNTEDVSELLVKKLNMGLTIMYGKRGFSGKEQEILYVIIERLRLAKLKEEVRKVDPLAFIAVQTLHEVVSAESS